MIPRFVQVETTLHTSRLIDRLCDSCGLDTNEAIGTMVRFWMAVLDAGIGGKVGDRTDRWIEHLVQWRGTPGCFAGFIRKWHLDDEGRIKDWVAKYGQIDARRVVERHKKRRQRHPDASLWHLIYERDNRTCRYCDCPLPDRGWTCDHVIPVSEGGTTDEENLVLSCRRCNVTAGKMVFANFTAKRSYIRARRFSGAIGDNHRDNQGTYNGTMGGTSLPSTTSTSSVFSSSSKSQNNNKNLNGEKPLDEEFLTAPDQLARFLDQYDFGPYRADVAGLVRAARVPESIMGALRAHLIGLNVPVRTPEHVGRAVQEWRAASDGGPFRAAAFRVFVERLDKDDARQRSQKRAATETSSIEREQAEAKQREREAQREELRLRAMIEQIKTLDPARYNRITDQAKAAVEGEGVLPGAIGYQVLVDAKLRQLVREELEHAGA